LAWKRSEETALSTWIDAGALRTYETPVHAAKRLAPIFLTAALSAACGSDDGAANGGAGGSGGGGCAAETTDYPAGPYGATVGAVFPPLEWRGRVNLTAEGLALAQPVVEYSADDVRRSCKGYALVHISEFF
jgi:hypothetical protein